MYEHCFAALLVLFKPGAAFNAEVPTKYLGKLYLRTATEIQVFMPDQYIQSTLAVAGMETCSPLTTPGVKEIPVITDHVGEEMQVLDREHHSKYRPEIQNRFLYKTYETIQSAFICLRISCLMHQNKNFFNHSL